MELLGQTQKALQQAQHQFETSILALQQALSNVTELIANNSAITAKNTASIKTNENSNSLQFKLVNHTLTQSITDLDVNKRVDVNAATLQSDMTWCDCELICSKTVVALTALPKPSRTN